MSKGHKSNQHPYFNPALQRVIQPKPGSFLDHMVDGREYQSIAGLQGIAVDLGSEMKRAMAEISAIRKRPIICYISNMLNPTVASSTSISIDNSDDAPFIELLKAIPQEEKAVDIILVTPGGSAETVDYYVKKLRKRFESIGFILPYMAMSAGTIFCMSGDELIMDEAAFIGPIDPQVPSKNGMFVPAQSIMTLIEEIKLRGIEQLNKGLQPDWTDIALLKNIDPKEIGNAINASALSTRLVTEYLRLYKFRDWETHKDGRPVTPQERDTRANEIASLLCNNSIWLSHASRITREMATNICKLKVTYPESIDGLDRAIKRFWALMRLTFENNTISKIYATGDYFLFRSVNIVPVPTPKEK